MKVYGQLERAQLENLSADPSGAGLVNGRYWFNTSSSQAKFYDGSSIQVFGSLAASSDAVAASMTSTGTSSIAGTMTTGNADTIINKISAPSSAAANLIAALLAVPTTVTPSTSFSGGAQASVVSSGSWAQIGKLIIFSGRLTWTQSSSAAFGITLGLPIVSNVNGAFSVFSSVGGTQVLSGGTFQSAASTATLTASWPVGAAIVQYTAIYFTS